MTKVLKSIITHHSASIHTGHKVTQLEFSRNKAIDFLNDTSFQTNYINHKNPSPEKKFKKIKNSLVS